MRPIPGTITDPAVDKVLFRSDPRPKTVIELTEREGETLTTLVAYLLDRSQLGSGEIFLLERDLQLLEKFTEAVN